jgi:hypothetical protein
LTGFHVIFVDGFARSAFPHSLSTFICARNDLIAVEASLQPLHHARLCVINSTKCRFHEALETQNKNTKTFIDVFADSIPRSCFAAIILARPKAKYKTQIGRKFICK